MQLWFRPIFVNVQAPQHHHAPGGNHRSFPGTGRFDPQWPNLKYGVAYFEFENEKPTFVLWIAVSKS
jgi:hypothetical protein